MNSNICYNLLHYHTEGYDSKGRFNSYWHQIDEIRKRNPKRILEVGIGSGFLNHYLKSLNLNITTLDIELNLKPDVIGSVLALPLKSNSFEMVVCFQVLEHLPFESFPACLKELSRVSKRWVVISLPDATRGVSLFIRSTGRVSWTKILIIPHFIRKKHTFNGEHYWEIGKKGFPLRFIRKIIENTGLKFIKTYRVPEFMIHRFFVLENDVK